MQDILKQITDDSTVFQNFLDSTEKTFQDQIVWPMWLRPDLTMGLDFRAVASKLEAVPMASVVDYESGKPLSDKQKQAILSGELETMGNAWEMSKRDMLKYKNILDSTIVTDPNELVRAFFGDINEAIVGPNKRIDYLMLQSISKGTLEVTKADNPKGKPVAAIDWQIANSGVATVWTDAAATPLTDIENAIEAQQDKGINVTQVLMNRATFRNMTATNQVKQAFGQRITTGNKMVTQAGQVSISLKDLNTYVEDQYGYTIVIENSLFHSVKGDAAVRGFADHRVCLKPDGAFGEMAYMQPLEMEAQDQGWSYAFSQYVMVKKQNKNGTSVTENEMTAFPIISRAPELYILKTDETA